MQTDRTKLSLLTHDDFKEILEMYEEPDTFKYIAPLRNKSHSEYLNFLESRIAQIKDKIGYHWVVRSLNTNEFIGLINLNPIRDSERMQVGFQLKRKFWSQGYATELTGFMLDFGFHHLGLKELYGVFSRENIASARIFEKLGFYFEESKLLEGQEVPIEIWKYNTYKNV
jgi:ribosomal-protein-alanine N-acetyltransferase